MNCMDIETIEIAQTKKIQRIFSTDIVMAFYNLLFLTLTKINDSCF